MKILFDQGTPVPLRAELVGHEVSTAHEMGWARLTNGELLAAAEPSFELLLTTDKNLQYQQMMKNRRLAIIVLPTTSWPQIQKNVAKILQAISTIQPGVFISIEFTE